MFTKARATRRGAGPAAALSMAALLLGAAGTAVLAAPPGEVPGNNGTVKIHDGAGEPASEVRNEPHVCTFHLHFFFADAADAGTWEIQEWAPGDKGTVVLTGTYLTDADGEDRDPATGVYELPDGHYKLFWDGDLDTAKHDKHKVFWVDCVDDGEASPTPEGSVAPTAETTATPTPTTSAEETTSPTPEGSVAPITGTPLPTGSVEGVVGTPAVTLPPTDMAETAVDTRSGLGLALLLLAGVLASMALAMTMLPTRVRHS